jgi:two-component system cell cycle sensor histidine kinase PleC
MGVDKSKKVMPLKESNEIIAKPTEALLLDVIAEGVIVRIGQSIVYVNDAARKMFGFPAEVAVSDEETIEKWIHPDDASIVNENYQQRMAGGDAAVRYEFRILRNDGSLCWVSCKAEKVTWDGQDAVVACLTDITEQKEAARALDRTERLFTNIFRLTPEVMLLTNLRDRKILDVNPAFLNVFGRRRDDVIGKTSDELDIWADNTFLNRFVEELKMTASMTDVPATVRTRGNLVRHFRLFAQKIDHDKDQLLLLIGRDITDDLVQSQELQRSRDTAELANRAKSEFLANMSHELRTPLNAILGFAEILRDQIIGPIGNERYSEYAQDIHESGTHLLEIINDILDLSKVEAGRLEAHLTWIEPIECLEMCLTLVQQRAFEGQVSIRHDLDDSVLLEADERLVKQIGLNLMTNAVKFTESGGTVTLSLTRTANAGLCLSVVDTGIGMTADEIKIARRPFGQVDSSLARKQEGSGLGLPLVSAFTEKLNATMTIESMPGEGTRVNILFPPFKVKDKVEKQD